MTWKPKKSDIEWTENLVNVLKNDAIWAGIFGMIQFNKEKKTFTVLETFCKTTVKRASIILTKYMGYTKV